MASDEVTPTEQGSHATRRRLGFGHRLGPALGSILGLGSVLGLGSGEKTEAGSLEFERVMFFTDAVFAIAITLLVIDLRVPVARTVQATHVLRAAVPSMIGFGIGFAMIGLFWLGHHAMCRHLTAMNGRLIRLNLLFLGAIAFLPYPTALLSATSGQVAPVVFFAVCAGTASLIEAAFWLYAVRVPGLLSADLSGRQRRVVAVRILRVPLVFGVSIPVAFADPGAAQYLWIMLWVLGLAINGFAPEKEGTAQRPDTPAE